MRSRDAILEPHQIALENKLNQARKTIFSDLLQVFPRYSIGGVDTSRRSLFGYLHQLDVIKSSSEVLEGIKKDYKKILVPLQEEGFDD